MSENYERFTEETIQTEGWYFFYPKHPGKYERPKFVLVDSDSIEGGYLKCKRYAGTYVGPVQPPAQEATEDRTSPAVDKAIEALQPFADILNDTGLDCIGGGTRIAPSITVQMVKDAKEALAGLKGEA